MLFIDKTALYMIADTRGGKVEAQNIMRKQLQTNVHRMDSW